MGTREHSIATWCKRFQIDLWKLRDRMKAGELTVYEKRAEGDVVGRDRSAIAMSFVSSGVAPRKAVTAS
jgi:hypothetical protein